MPQTLELHLLGGLNIGLAEKPPLRFASRRAEVLLAYMGMNPQLHSRESLATLLWDDRDQKQAMANLRSLLAQLPQALKPYLNITRQSVAFRDEMPVWVDAVVFMETGRSEAAQSPISNLPVSQLEETAALYKGGFLDGVFVRESRGLEEWTAVTRDRLQQQAILAFSQLAHTCFYRRDYVPAIQHTQALLALDPLREGSHRLLMRLLARNGQLNAAMQQYEQCRAVLDEELGIAPSPPTRQLHQRLLSAKLPAPFIVPSPQTPFVGREEALALIEARLDDDQCRLLTILGTGGVGKSRLVLQIARQRRRDYLHGIYFVSLVGVETADTIATTIATTLNCQLQDNEPLLNQVISFLQEKELLLILDNFEHLLPDGAGVLQTLLEAAPGVKWLVTSRERLHLPAEWIVPVMGLSTENEAMPLFVQRAQQANAHFVVDDETTMAVQQICQSVQGLPLGIELAAALVRTLSCAEIAAKVNQSLAILSDQVDDHPQRHQSLQAVFDSSWRMLTTAEQDALLKLAVFQGGFERQAAQQVAGATLPLLAGLLDKSLLVRDETDGRYALLEVLRQLIQEKWTPQLKQTVRTAHCHYYAEFVAAGRLAASLAQEMDNVRLAWHTAVQHHPQWIPQFLDELHAVYRTSAWLQEGYDAWATATNKLLHSPQLVAKLQARQAELAISLGRFDEAKKLLESSLATIRPLNDKVELASVLYHLGRATFMNGDVQKSENFARESYHLYVQLDSPVGMAKTLRTQGSIASAKGQYDLATDYHMQSLAIYRQTDDGKALASTLNSLASNYCEIGNWQEALPLYEESLAMYRQINHLFHIAALLNNIGTVQVATKQFEQAEQNYQESAAICRQIGDGAGIAIALMNRGISALNQEDYARAEGYLLESIALYKDNSYPYMETIALQNMGVVAFHLQQYEAAEQYSLGAIRLALASEAMGLVANTLDNIARLRAHDGDYEAAMVLVAFVLHSDLSNQEAKDRTQQLEADLLPTMTTAQVERARENGRSLTLDAILAQISNL